ncbi:MAG: CHRD domain-containing protein [Dechloromonas sp.]|nr:CHRD domain-containing protein [Dechloromonas sp.]
MNQALHVARPTRQLLSLTLVGLLAFAIPAFGAGWAVNLSGAQEVPPNTSAAKGSGEISVMADGAVSGSITVSGMTPTAAHIHDGASTANGPVIIKLDRTANGFAVPAGAKFTDEQLAKFKAGNTYVNVHSDAFPPGEIRGQLTAPATAKPKSAY